jgi:ABC-type sugar transport system ATPase subunit
MRDRRPTVGAPTGVAVGGLNFVRDGRVVLDIPDLRFPAGTVTAVFGPNGSGKSTLIRLIAGLERPTAGTVRLGSVAAGASPAARRQVGLAFQEPIFVRGSVRHNLELALELRGVPAAERAERIMETARECGITGVLDRPARQLSGGEAQRANLARALALRAPVTLLDEPLAGIDRVARTQLLDDLPRLLAAFAATTIIVTHDREEAFRLADRLVVLVGGGVRAAGPKALVYGRPPDRETAELLGYTVLRVNGRTIAVPPGGLRPGAEPPSVTLAVERVFDMGHHHHVVGTIDGWRADVRLPAGAVPPRGGQQMRLTVSSHVALPDALDGPTGAEVRRPAMRSPARR